VAYSSNVLQRLAERAQPGSSVLLLDALADWQDNDDFTRLHGAEAWEYRRDNYPYEPRNAPIQCISELRLIKGLDRALYQQLETDLTYWPVHTNYLTMRADMLRAMFDDQALVDQLLALRQQGLLTAGLFSTMSGMPLDEDTFLFPSDRLQMIVTASVQRARSRIEVVVSKQPAADQPFTIFEWRR
jgi:type II secretory pathway component PulK